MAARTRSVSSASRTGREVRDDDLVEARARRPGVRRRGAPCRIAGQGDAAERDPRVGAKVGGRLLGRPRHAPQAGDDVVVGDDDAERGVADDDRQQAEVDAGRLKRRAQRDPGHHARAGRSAGPAGTRSSRARRTRSAARPLPPACRAPGQSPPPPSAATMELRSARGMAGLAAPRRTSASVKPGGGQTMNRLALKAKMTRMTSGRYRNARTSHGREAQADADPGDSTIGSTPSQ